ncbi:hypothetical protein [Pseudomonas sp. C2B4]|uniref:hypothetical protein n=1 Tax=Pseudomonas sp. C2B4 TaxID=2735270 RepID=UPI0015869421|nr:hypothetical protein [Pseudomonas sp. C2B4]NUU38221.1 hypothetical protein [Pseudomonas sp. C2B4]
MDELNESNKHLEQVRQSRLFRWALILQWLGLALFLLAVGLALFTNLLHEIRGVILIAVLGMLGLLSLVPARFILTVQLMTPHGINKTGLSKKPPEH